MGYHEDDVLKYQGSGERLEALPQNPMECDILDWHHLTMKLTVLGQYDKGLVQCEAVLGEAIQDQLERLKWSLWHGQVDKALGKIDELETALEPFSETYARFPRLVTALSRVRTYIVNNRHLIPNYGERYCNGELIASGFVESTVNEVVSKRFCKKQQMQWSKEGTHVLLQTRVRTPNGELSAIFKALASGHEPCGGGDACCGLAPSISMLSPLARRRAGSQTA